MRGSADQNVGYTTVGLRAAQTMQWAGMTVTPNGSVAWLHAFSGVTPDASLAFASTGIGFTVYGVPLAQDSALIDAGLDLELGPEHGRRVLLWPVRRRVTDKPSKAASPGSFDLYSWNRNAKSPVCVTGGGCSNGPGND